MRIIIEIDEQSHQIETLLSPDDTLQLDGGTPPADLLSDLGEAADAAGNDVGGPPEWLVAAVTLAEQQAVGSDAAVTAYTSTDLSDGGAAPTAAKDN